MCLFIRWCAHNKKSFSCFFWTRFTRKRNPLDHFKGSSVLDQTMESGTSTQAQHQWKQMDSEGKKVAVHEEMKRMNQLPTNSTYATHRLRVLNKILQLISIQVNNHWNSSNNIFNVNYMLFFLGLITFVNIY